MDKGYSLNKKKNDWICWQAVVPLLVIGASFLIARCVVRVDCALEKSFSGGDLFLFASMLLMAVFVELSHVMQTEDCLKEDTELDARSRRALVLAFLTLFAYAVIKEDFTGYRFPVIGVDPKYTWYAYLSMVWASYAVLFSNRTMWQVVDALTSRK